MIIHIFNQTPMNNIFRNKKFQLKQKIKKLDPKVELFVLEGMLKRAEKEENYELCIIIISRTEKVKKDETQDRS